MNQKNIKIGGVLYEVVEMEQFVKAPEGMYDTTFTAILFKERTDEYGNLVPAIVLPFRTQPDFSRGIPGIYGITCDGMGFSPVFRVIFPFHLGPGNQLIVDKYEYLAKNMLDTGNAKNMQDLINLDAKYREFEFDIITASDNSIMLKVTPNDTAEMAAFKQAINDKHIDLDKYRPRFGKTYPNDKRSLINGDSITFTKLKEYANALDMKISLSIDNASPDVPNPMSHPITVQITGQNVVVPTNESIMDDDDEEEYQEEE